MLSDQFVGGGGGGVPGRECLREGWGAARLVCGGGGGGGGGGWGAW